MSEEFDFDSLGEKFDELSAPEKEPAEEEALEPEEEALEPEIEQKADDIEPEPEGEPEKPALETQYQIPPSSWDKEAKEQYKDLPDWAKRQAHKREADIFKGIEGYKQKSSQFDSVLSEHKDFIEKNNISPQAALNDAISLAKALQTGTPEQKARILQSIARQYGADTEIFKEEVDPQALQMQQYLSPLLSEIGQIKAALRTQPQPSNDVDNSINEFRAEVDDTGNPKYPFFNVVENLMATVMPQVISENQGATPKQLLAKAYEQAVWAHPDTRQFLQSEQAKRSEAERQKQAAERKAELEKANKNNLHKKGAYDTEAPTGNIMDTLSTEYDRLVGA